MPEFNGMFGAINPETGEIEGFGGLPVGCAIRVNTIRGEIIISFERNLVTGEWDAFMTNWCPVCNEMHQSPIAECAAAEQSETSQPSLRDAMFALITLAEELEASNLDDILQHLS